MILLVNNDKAMLNGLEDILRRCRYAVIVPRDRSSALAEIASGERIDLVITDHQMNGISELAVLKALRQTRPDVPAIILTERGTLDSYLKAINLGVIEYLEHTVGFRELLRIVADTLGDSSEEESGCASSFTSFEQKPKAVRTAYDRGYSDVV
jgi:two-component system response regulator FlrC